MHWSRRHLHDHPVEVGRSVEPRAPRQQHIACAPCAPCLLFLARCCRLLLPRSHHVALPRVVAVHAQCASHEPPLAQPGLHNSPRLLSRSCLHWRTAAATSGASHSAQCRRRGMRGLACSAASSRCSGYAKAPSAPRRDASSPPPPAPVSPSAASESVHVAQCCLAKSWIRMAGSFSAAARCRQSRSLVNRSTSRSPSSCPFNHRAAQRIARSFLSLIVSPTSRCHPPSCQCLFAMRWPHSCKVYRYARALRPARTCRRGSHLQTRRRGAHGVRPFFLHGCSILPLFSP